MSKKEIIGFNNDLKQKYIHTSNDKLTLLNNAIILFKEQTKTEIQDIKEFEKSFYKYACNFVQNKHPKALELGLTADKLHSLYGYDFTELKELETSYQKSNVVLRFENNKFNIDTTIDFNIYAETPTELERLKDCKELINTLTKFHKKYMNGSQKIQQTSFVNGFLTMDYSANKLIPNHYFIKS